MILTTLAMPVKEVRVVLAARVAMETLDAWLLLQAAAVAVERFCSRTTSRMV